MDGKPYLGKRNRMRFSRAQTAALERAAERLNAAPEIVEEFFTGFCYTTAKLQRRNMQYVDVGQKGKPARLSISIPMFGHLRYHKHLDVDEATEFSYIKQRNYSLRTKRQKEKLNKGQEYGEHFDGEED